MRIVQRPFISYQHTNLASHIPCEQQLGSHAEDQKQVAQQFFHSPKLEKYIFFIPSLLKLQHSELHSLRGSSCVVILSVIPGVLVVVLEPNTAAASATMSQLHREPLVLRQHSPPHTAAPAPLCPAQHPWECRTTVPLPLQNPGKGRQGWRYRAATGQILITKSQNQNILS